MRPRRARARSAFSARGVQPHQLPYYLDEFTFRFNRRTSTKRGLLFYRLLQQALATDPHPLSDLLHPGVLH
jgi:hypothetical protein